MSQRTSIFYDIITEFKGMGAKQAESALGKLESTAKKVAVSFAGIFAIEKLAAFSKEAVNAFGAESKQAAVFTQTIQGLGFALQNSQIVEYINKISESTGTLKDQLEPAFGSLLRYTRSVSESQKLFNLALDISAGTGKGLLEVSNALGRAYLGNYTALVRLGAGITTTSAKGKTFEQNIQVLTAAFNGDAKAAAESFGGTLDRLKVAAHEATVNIGAGLAASLISLSQMGGNGSFSWLTTLGDKVNGFIYQITKFALTSRDILGGLNPFNIKNWTGQNNVGKTLASDIAKLDANFAKTKAQSLGLANQNNQATSTALSTLNKTLSTQKALTAQQQQQLALKKAQAVLDNAAKVLDVQQAEIVAAMMNASLTQDELLRLKLKQALLNDNATAAGQYAQQLIAAQVASLQLAAANPFGAMNLDIINATKSLMDLAAALAALAVPPQITQLGGLAAFQAKVAAVPTYESYASPWQFGGASADKVYQSTNAQGVTVTLIDATTGGVNAVTQNNSLNGTPATVTRYAPIGGL